MGNVKKLLVTTLTLALFLTSVQTAFATFKDVKETHENYAAINYVQAEGIVIGYNDGTYRPENKINRAEFTKIIIASRFSVEEIDKCYENEIAEKQTKVFFNDVLKTDWYGKYICVAKNQNIIKGFDDNTFRPLNRISFAEAAKIIAVAFGAQIGAETEPWYKIYVEALAGTKSIPMSIYSFDQQLSRGEMAEIIYRFLADVNDKPYKTYADLQ